MARRTFTIELKVDLGNEEDRYEPMKNVVMEYARQLLATSILLAEGHRAPSVTCFTENAYFSTESIEIKLDENGELILDAPVEEDTSEVTEGEEICIKQPHPGDDDLDV